MRGRHFTLPALVDVLRSLLEHGADVNVQDANGNTSIHLAATQDNVGVMLLLLEEGEADPN